LYVSPEIDPAQGVHFDLAHAIGFGEPAGDEYRSCRGGDARIHEAKSRRPPGAES
jgi:hypothetical protein